MVFIQNEKYVIGKIYGVLKLKSLFNKNKRKMALVECIYCKKEKVVRASDLYTEKQISCRCQTIKHNMNESRIYGIYHNMKYRCYNENCDAYKNYGKKGIKICNEWLGDNGFINFYNWSMDNGYNDDLTIDRIDSNGNYEPNNCRWITLSENVTYANKTNQRRFADKGTYYGIDKNGVQYEFDNANAFAKTHGLNAGCVRKCANGGLKTYKGWKFGFINEKQ